MATAALVAGTALMAGGQIRQGQLAAAQGEASNEIAKLNAANLERQATARREAATLEDQRQIRKANMALGTQIARGGASGVVSDVDFLADTAFQFAMDRNLMLRQSLVESQGLLGQAAMTRAEGKFAKQVGKSQRNTAYMKAGGSILAGGYEGYQRGLFSGGGGTSSAGTGFSGASRRTGSFRGL